MAGIRVALILGGGVSLGSFSAGALVEALRLLHRHAVSSDVKVDVVSGASAGSMTLAVALHHLFRGSSLAELERTLRKVWVKEITFHRLFEDPTRHRKPSLFSDRIVQELAHAALPFDDTPIEPGPHDLLAEGTLASFALTNLNGIPVRTEGQIIRQAQADGAPPTGPRSPFADAVRTTFHDDAIRFRLVRRRTERGRSESGPLESGAPGPLRDGIHELGSWEGEEGEPEGWALFRKAAIASGAFPVAFPPVRLPRERDEYASGKLWPEELEGDRFVYDFADGGVLRNEPLREAIQLAAMQDRGRRVERVFIFIDPNVSGTKEAFSLPYNQPARVRVGRSGRGRIRSMRVESPDYMQRLLGLARRLSSVVTSQAAFRDWLRAARVNSRIEWRDELLEILGALEAPPGSDLNERTQRLLWEIYRERHARTLSLQGTEPTDDRIDEEIERDLRARAGGGEPSLGTRLTLLVDLVANLRAKRKLNMVAITPASAPGGDEIPLAGNFLANFGGFFEEEYRIHDFQAGRFVAGQVLSASVGDARRLIREGTEVPPAPEPFGEPPSFRRLPEEVQQAFGELLKTHGRAALKAAGAPRVLRGLAAWGLERRIQRRLMGLEPVATASFVVRIEGALGLRLRKGPRGANRRPDRSGVITTVVHVSRVLGGKGRYRFSGPHVQTQATDDSPFLEVFHRKLLRSLPAGRFVLEGSPAEWFEMASRTGVPILKLAPDPEGATVSVGVDRLEEEDP